MELEEGMERVQISISVLRSFKGLFHTYRQQIPAYYKHEKNTKLWDFPATLIFKRLDCIMERLLMIEDIFATALDFLKLEKVELGGSRGKILSEMVFSMSEEFHDRWRTLRESKYDPFDYTNDDFVHHHRRFVEQNKDFDQRLGTVLNLAFHHSKNLNSAFKLQSGCAVLGKNMPSVAGNLKWSQELRSRILTDRSNFCQLPHMPLGSAEADEVLRKCEHLLEILEKHDEELFSEWTEGLEDV
ncbi:dynein heavy chain 11, axonemal-like, partial [Fundulus heteroclitus]|uniref:dynein heavy chain 11, axonemal-like n=1 Tax=Fundulus heteroclitus TaxID=8078 RepID=UPI00165C5E21